ncbi:pyruvate dehydrogenase E1 component subunit beta [Williamsoniiplasma luminosum]|uniref:Alpha-ketoacid dehydrogenase subunit beta n=1 Tax=Williamsoniiplasma luminosum TaxID=214888 RepID=A0A2K8NT49_9MOLU|nr:alpha-ketoacid dehydrogenase subunit beta [Williamsoniiplasma luminosum]ATZ16736.1 pyruvate dehydrogenase E1 component subunit beta [Williamsoniiplasma luminosum]AVP49415.1 MAG: alpha-ketoacid dehydrogenase subunit beta [Williamsoniiplasma luminosum]
MAVLNNVQAVTNALDVAMEKWDEVVVFGEDVGQDGGVFRATMGLWAKYGENRCFSMPISEALFAGAGYGMAVAGMKPVVEFQFEGLGWASLQNILTQIAKVRNRSRGKYSAPMVIRMPMGGGIRALEHHSEAMEAIYAHCAGLKVVIPSTPYDTKGLLLAAIESPDPIIVFEPTKLYRAFKQEVPDGYYTVPIGEAYKIQEGNDLTVVTYGAQTVDCEKAIDMLLKERPNASIELIDLRTIQPWDRKMVFESVKKTGRLLVVHEAVKQFSVSSEIIASVNEECFEYLKAPLSRCTGYDISIPFDRGEGYHQVNPTKVLVKMKEVLDYQF